jgi:hypothetical protein
MVRAAVANGLWCVSCLRSHRAYRRALHDPQGEQAAILRRYLRENAATEFGRAHGFAGIGDAREYARRVPARDYDELSPWIERVRLGNPNVLTAAPVRRLVPTSGSTAARKLIPYTGAMQAELNRAVGPWIVGMYRHHPSALLGPAYWSVSPAAEAMPEDDGASAVPIGFDDDAEYLGGWARRLVDAAMAVPGAVRLITNFNAWRYVTLLLLLRCPGLRLISVWHPSFFGLLLGALAGEWERLLRDVAEGGCAVMGELPAGLRGAVMHRPMRSRAAELSRVYSGAAGEAQALWPSLSVVSAWGDGQASSPAAALAATFPRATFQAKGLLATEGVVSIPFAGKHPLALRSHFLEFEDDEGTIALAADLRHGATYRVNITTGGGLYRCRLHDFVVVDGFVGATPSIRFVGKAALLSDRFGEKLSEGFVVAALMWAFDARPLPAFCMLAPDAGVRNGSEWRYTLYVDGDVPDELPTRLEEALMRNPHYAYCRRLGQLLPPRAFRITGEAFAAYSRRLESLGRRLGDIKPAALSPLDGWSRVFDGEHVPSGVSGG